MKTTALRNEFRIPVALLALSSGAIALPVALLALCAGAVGAQETIITDRPGLGLTTVTVPAGTVQIEAGIPAAVATDAGTDARLINTPALVRVGVLSSLELRVGSTLFNRSRVAVAGATETTDGFGAVEVGTKLGFTTGDNGPSLALIPSVLLPVDRKFSGDRPAYTLNGVASWSLPAKLALTTVAGLAVNPDGDDDHVTSGAFVAVLGRSLAARAGGYIEAAWYPNPQLQDAAYAGAGVTYLLSNSVQVDAFIDHGISAVAMDWLFGLGAALRL
jgi:hypothetical protein